MGSDNQLVKLVTKKNNTAEAKLVNIKFLALTFFNDKVKATVFGLFNLDARTKDGVNVKNIKTNQTSTLKIVKVKILMFKILTTLKSK